MLAKPRRMSLARSMLYLVAISGAAVSGSASGATYIVAPDGSGDYPTIQAALDAADTGDIIELANGDFEGDGNYLLDPMGKELTIRSQSGLPESCWIYASSGGGEWQGYPCFYIHSGEGPGLQIEGVSMHGPPSGGGASALILDASPIFRNCRFIDNQVEFSGGAVACDGLSSPQFEGCVFDSNAALGTYSEGGAATLSFGGRFESCVFRDNSARSSGAVHCDFSPSGGSVEFDACVFIDNSATEGSGGAIGGGGGSHFLAVRNSTFMGNWSELYGAAISYASSIDNTIITGSFSENPLAGWIVGSVGAVNCTNIFGNYNGGDDESWEGVLAEYAGVNGNLSLDPQFCGPEGDNYYLQSDSPCAPGNNSCGVLIGALPVGCEMVSTQDASWGAIKALY